MDKDVSISLTFVVILYAVTICDQVRSGSVDGGIWEESSPCSRSCGGGVAIMEHKCTQQTGGAGLKNCTESTKVYKSCNLQDCPVTSRDFRAEQCSSYDAVPFNGQLYKWIPYQDLDNRCALNCFASGTRLHHQFANKVVDGTPCGDDTLDVCIDGKCTSVGCDREIGSLKQLDACLVCGGNGVNCSTLHGLINTYHMNSGYNALIHLPDGATSIMLQEEGTSRNFFAIRNQHNVYYLNGAAEMEEAEPLFVAGTVFFYSRLSNGMEQLTSVGPINESLFIEIFKQDGPSPAVKYDYSFPQEISSDARGFSWVASSWSSCNVSCGDGFMQRTVSCIDVSSGEKVEDQICSMKSKPAAKQFCSDGPCTARWHTGPWGKCSKFCKSGLKNRTVSCERTADDGQIEVVSASQCQLPKPSSVETCNENVMCPEWEVGNWSRCNKVCGSGNQTRLVICKAKHKILNAKSDLLPDVFCDIAIKPEVSQGCDAGPCDGLEWMTSEWSGCHRTCERNETRQVSCSSKLGVRHEDDECDISKKPDDVRTCTLPATCGRQIEPKWFASQWSSCSVDCGVGVQRRSVFCGTQSNNQVKKQPAESCDLALKMTDQQECTGTCGAVWFTGPFGKCSSVCGGGVRTRDLLCFVGNNSVDLSNCDGNNRPDEMEDCNQNPCDDDHLLVAEADNCKKSEYGCCPDQFTAAEGPGYQGCASLDSIPSGLCAVSDFGCCADGVTTADGPFLAGCPIMTCRDTTFGCCADGKTAAGDSYGKGCPTEITCRDMAFGCCPDGVSIANGANGEGCENAPTSIPSKSHQFTTNAISTDSVSTVMEEDMSITDDVIVTEIAEKLFDVYITAPSVTELPDVVVSESDTAAEKEMPECSSSSFGCCPDDVTFKLGANGEGCASRQEEGESSGEVPEGCQSSTYGCCPDGRTAAEGPNHQGCNGVEILTDCFGSTYGCCPDGETPMQGSDYEGCFDGGLIEEEILSKTEDSGLGALPPSESCDLSENGCCIDGKTPAMGPRFYGCPEKDSYIETCEDSHYGCCSDEITPAEGPNEAGCPARLQKLATCSAPKDPGPCTNFSVKWFFDLSHGDCSRFWYGSCEGNGNRFETREECRSQCVSPKGLDKCYLPQSAGRCNNILIKYSYDPNSKKCVDFIFKGCLGNENRFDSMEMCEKECIEPQKSDVCSQPAKRGPCRGSFDRWYFDKTQKKCQQFAFGGCRGNDNNFRTESECEQRCKQSSVHVCHLEKDQGPCQAEFYRWYFNKESGQCEEFVYTGCQGNENRFLSKMECEKSCDAFIKRTVSRCSQPRNSGSCTTSRLERWYYDSSDGYCKQFVFGGCGGNDNRFDSEPACRQACDANPPIDVCTLRVRHGTCRENIPKFHFDTQTSQCIPFTYTGCDGNANNFGSIDDCRQKCLAHIMKTLAPGTDRCTLPRDPGPCISAMKRWHYSSQEERCIPFEYGGCGGNRNRFLTEDICSHECVRTTVTSTTTTTTTTTTAPPTTTTTTTTTVPPTTRRTTTIEEQTPEEEDSVVEEYDYNDSNNTDLEDFEHNDEHESEYYDNYDHPTDEMITTQPTTTTTHPTTTTTRPTTTTTRPTTTTTRPTTTTTRPTTTTTRPTTTTTRPTTTTTRPTTTTTRPTTTTTRPMTSMTTESSSRLAICILHSDVGPCKASIQKWHYDPEKGQCVKFRYGGCDGNDNRFDTKEECESICSVEEICQLPSEYGSCETKKGAKKQRFHFNFESGECEKFVYSGCNGNANRFLKLENCENVCKNRLTTAPQMKLTTESETTTIETTTELRTIPVMTTASVDRAGLSKDLCSLKSDAGPCDDWALSWYYDSELLTCRRFWYGGCEGNGNRFDTAEECMSKCGDVEPSLDSTTRPSFTTIAEEEEVYETVESIDSHPSESHPSEEESHSWEEESHPSEEESHSSEEESHPSEESHPTEESHPWEESHSSEEESYPSEKELHSTDDKIVSIAGICQLSPDHGEYCTGWNLFWHFDMESGNCLQFYYGGCAGNENRFETEEACLSKCSGAGAAPTSPADEEEGGEEEEGEGGDEVEQVDEETIPSEPSTEAPSAADVDVCLLAVVIGTCWDDQTRWYFDELDGECKEFSYSGCDGNGNNFDSESECIVQCHAHLRDVESKSEEDYNEIEVPNICDELYDCDLKCSYGYTRDGNDCPQCQCYDPCENYECSESMECHIENISCSDEQCLEFRPFCKPKPKSRSDRCPELDPAYIEAVGCLVECRADTDCFGSEICCSTGCGSICAKPKASGCMNTPFRCCLDGVTPAKGWNYQGCPEESPVIEETKKFVLLVKGDDVEINCKARGSPLPQINWFKNGQPVVDEQQHVIIQRDGALKIKDVTVNDTGSYSCRAFNNVGSATHTFNVEVGEPADIVDASAVQDLWALEGTDVDLGCIATGHPTPTVRWLKDMESVPLDESRLQQHNKSLNIKNIQPSDEGDYECEADNGIGEPTRKTFKLNVKRLLTVMIHAPQHNYSSGDTIKLSCDVISDNKGPVQVTWSRSGKEITSMPNGRISTDSTGRKLTITNSNMADSGDYSCKATEDDQESKSKAIAIKVTGNLVSDSCTDKPWYANCQLIVEADLCSHPYFSVFCCATCVRSGKL